MVKYLKYCLSLLFLTLILSCENKIEPLSTEEKIALSKEIYSTSGRFGQGTAQQLSILDSVLALDPSNCKAIRARTIAYLKRG